MDDDVSELVDGPGPAPVKIARRWWVVSAAAALLLVVVLAAVIFYRQADKPFGFEVQWMGELVEARVPVFTALALAFNWIGGAIGGIVIVPLVIIAGLLIWRRPWAALYFLCAEIASAVVVLVMKNLIGRPRPTDILVTADVGSFPSGHSANAALIATTLGIIFWRTWVWIVGAAYTLLMMLSRTYLGAHWISDTIGGMLVGVGLAVVIWAPFAFVLYRERRKPHPPIWVKVATPEPAIDKPGGSSH
jgi:undecaprenyl-diphosphatase